MTTIKPAIANGIAQHEARLSKNLASLNFRKFWKTYESSRKFRVLNLLEFLRHLIRSTTRNSER